MKINFVRLAYFLFCFLLAANAGAQNKGLIWEYSKDGQKGYLLGSVHFASSDFYPLAKPILNAYEQSDKLVVEVDDSLVKPEKQQALLARYGFYPPGETLLDNLSAATLKEISELLGEFGLKLDQVKNYRPGMLAIQLTALQASKLGFSPEQGIDRYFMQKARFKKNIEQIETFESQMQLIGRLPEDDELLKDSFSNMEDYEEQWLSTMETWKRGDAQGLYTATIGNALKEYPSLEPFFKTLFFDRHPRMLSVAERCVDKNEKCFIVVGAGHLVGPKGLIQDLKNKGYAVKQL